MRVWWRLFVPCGGLCLCVGWWPRRSWPLSHPLVCGCSTGKWYQATVLEVRLAKNTAADGLQPTTDEDDTRVYVDVTLGAGPSVRLWLSLQARSLKRAV
jgi:hypothetical protein